MFSAFSMRKRPSLEGVTLEPFKLAFTIRGFFSTGLDVLAIGDFIVEKSN